MSKRCPHCDHDIDYLCWRADYSGYGTAWGTVDPEGHEEWDDDEINDSETGDKTYECPNCNHELDEDFFDTPDEDEEEVEVDKPTPAEDEGTEFASLDSKYFRAGREIEQEFRSFMIHNCNLSDKEKEMELDEMIESYQNDYRDFCQLNK